MTAALTRDSAAAAVAAAVAERDTIQANLLDLDGSFGKRLLAGAQLTGVTRQRWEATTADLTTLWETFTAYSAVVDRAADALAAAGRSPGRALPELMALLTGPSVRLTRAASAVARGDLLGTADANVTPAEAVREMRRTFANAADVVAAAEAVWNAIADPLQQVETDLAAARQRAGGVADPVLADPVLDAALGLADTNLGQLREVLNRDPLALWPGGPGRLGGPVGQVGRVDTARLDRLREHAAAATARAGELAALRENADRRIAVVTGAVSAAREAWQDAVNARDRAAAKIAAELPAPPDLGGLGDRLAALDSVKAAGRWPRLASELDVIEEQAAAAARACRDAEHRAIDLLDRRDELRGLLDAYQVKAAKSGAAEDSELEVRYGRARDLLWTAPCDLSAAADAVTGYQQAVLALSGRGLRS